MRKKMEPLSELKWPSQLTASRPNRIAGFPPPLVDRVTDTTWVPGRIFFHSMTLTLIVLSEAKKKRLWLSR
jgi:hypothetical protein